MYRTIGGINVDPAAPGYRHAIIAPHVGGGLTSARTALQTGYGLLVTDWHVDGKAFTLNVTVPPNTTASITMPGATVDRVTESGTAVRGAAGVRQVVQRGSDVVVEVGSGSYAFRAGESASR
jgi:alpha-L-rhamnosidase